MSIICEPEVARKRNDLGPFDCRSHGMHHEEGSVCDPYREAAMGFKSEAVHQGEPRSEVEKHRVYVETVGNSVSKEGRSGRNYWY